MEFRLFFEQFNFRSLYVFALMVGVAACGTKDRQRQATNKAMTPSSGINIVQDATGFAISRYENFSVLHLVNRSHTSADTMSYVLAGKGSIIPDAFASLRKINIPAQNIALLHTSYLSFFDICQATKNIKAISEGRYVYDSVVYRAIREGQIAEVGYGESLDKEKLLALGTDVVFTVGFPNVPNKDRDQLEALGIPVLVMSDWQENSILGRFEWGRLVAEITGKGAAFSRRYDSIKSEYNALKSMASNVESRPAIICNLPYKGSWYMPGGNSYVSHLLHDAGGRYLWANTPETGGVQMDFEAIYAKGIDADFWINPGFAKSYDDMLDKDTRLADFGPMKKNTVFNNNNRLARGEANDYWESGIAQPQVVLADLISILHPEVLPNHQLYYYRRLKAHED